MMVLLLAGICIGAEKKPESRPQGKERTYHGKTVGEWTALVKAGDQKVRREAIEAMLVLGPLKLASIPVPSPRRASCARASGEAV